MKKILTACYLLASTHLYAQSNNVGIGTLNPGTSLDVQGGLTLRQDTVIILAGNVPTILPANSSQIIISGSSGVSTPVLTAPTPQNPGQLLTIFNNVSSGQTIYMNAYSIPNGRSVTFRSNGNTAASFQPDGVNANTVDVRFPGSSQTTITGTVTDGFVRFTSNAATSYTLPLYYKSQGQILYFYNSGAGAVSIQSGSGTAIIATGGVTGLSTLNLTTGQRSMLICDGTYWIRMY